MSDTHAAYESLPPSRRTGLPIQRSASEPSAPSAMRSSDSRLSLCCWVFAGLFLRRLPQPDSPRCRHRHATDRLTGFRRISLSRMENPFRAFYRCTPDEPVRCLRPDVLGQGSLLRPLATCTIPVIDRSCSGMSTGHWSRRRARCSRVRRRVGTCARRSA